MKFALAIVSIAFSFCYYGQGDGSIWVKAYENFDCNLSNNQPLDSIQIIVNKLGTDEVVSYTSTFNYNRSNLPELPDGKYQVTCILENNIEININEVQVSPDRFTLVTILIEPSCELNKSELKNRKKIYANFRIQ